MPATTLVPPGPAESLDDAGHALAVTLRNGLLSIYHEGGAGSAVVWPGGLVITNNHVVEGADARVVGVDASSA